MRRRGKAEKGRRGSGEQECECVPRHSGGILAVRRMSDAGPGACMRKPLGSLGCHWERTLTEGPRPFLSLEIAARVDTRARAQFSMVHRFTGQLPDLTSSPPRTPKGFNINSLSLPKAPNPEGVECFH
jgi:hypothetical protein